MKDRRPLRERATGCGLNLADRAIYEDEPLFSQGDVQDWLQLIGMAADMAQLSLGQGPFQKPLQAEPDGVEIGWDGAPLIYHGFEENESARNLGSHIPGGISTTKKPLTNWPSAAKRVGLSDEATWPVSTAGHARRDLSCRVSECAFGMSHSGPVE